MRWYNVEVHDKLKMPLPAIIVHGTYDAGGLKISAQTWGLGVEDLWRKGDGSVEAARKRVPLLRLDDRHRKSMVREAISRRKVEDHGTDSEPMETMVAWYCALLILPVVQALVDEYHAFNLDAPYFPRAADLFDALTPFVFEGDTRSVDTMYGSIQNLLEAKEDWTFRMRRQLGARCSEENLRSQIVDGIAENTGRGLRVYG